jgi:hypothetical protein
MKSGQSVSRYLRDNKATTALETPGNQDEGQGCRNKTVSPQRTKNEGAKVRFVFHLWRETHNFKIFRRKMFKISCIF